MRFCFDLDGTLCNTPAPVDADDMADAYTAASPIHRRIRKLNALHDDGHHIIIDTARGSGTGHDFRPLTERQLSAWGVKYHELRVGEKTWADEYIDDKGTNVLDWEAD